MKPYPPFLALCCAVYGLCAVMVLMWGTLPVAWGAVSCYLMPGCAGCQSVYGVWVGRSDVVGVLYISTQYTFP